MMNSMRVGYMHGPGDLRFTTAPAPELDDGQIRLTPLVGGICGSDLPYFTRAEDFEGNHPPLGSPLHEIVGVVDDSRATDLSTGDVVVGWASGNNALSSQVVTSAADVAIVHQMAPVAAIMAQPLACVLAVMDRLRTPLAGAHVAVLGLGPIGVLFAHVAHSMGATVSGVDPVFRYEDLSRFGITHAISSTAEQWATDVTDHPSVVFEVIGHQFTTLDAAITGVAPWGEVFYFGVPETSAYNISMAAMLRKHLTLQSGTTALDRPRYLTQALDHLHEHPWLAPALITHTFGFEQAAAAFGVATTPEPGVGKVLIDFR